MSEDFIDLPKVNIFIDPPAAATDPGVTGQVAIDSNYLYICIADNTWKRVAIATWP